MPKKNIYSSFAEKIIFPLNPNKILVKLSQAVASNEVLKYLIEQQIPIVSYNEVLPSLNDIFIQLVEDTHAKARAFQNI